MHTKRLHQLSVISTGDLVYEKRSKRWIQRTVKRLKIHKMELQLKVCKDSVKEFKYINVQATKMNKEIAIEGSEDTSCSIVYAGVQICHKLGFPIAALVKSNVTLKVADGRELTVLEVVPSGHLH